MKLNSRILLLCCLFCIIIFAGISRATTVATGIRINSLTTEEQLEFINQRYDGVISAELSDSIRNALDTPVLLLYRSIQDGWESGVGFHWAHMDSCENMFLHDTLGLRIWTIYSSWYMDGQDFEQPASPDSLDHWINYYSAVVSEQVRRCNYDGLFIDSAAHQFKGSATVPPNTYPAGYDSIAYRNGRYAALSFIKSRLPEKYVLFNGLHSRAGADSSLNFTDGGMWETFAFRINEMTLGQYAGVNEWNEVIELANTWKEDKIISLVSKRLYLTDSLSTRMFLVSSYFLVGAENIYFSLSDLTWGTSAILYYPEYDIEMGAPLGDYYMRGSDSLFIREFEDGFVLVNPFEDRSRYYDIPGTCYKINAAGGGLVSPDGSWEGSLSYEETSGTIEIPPVSGAVFHYYSSGYESNCNMPTATAELSLLQNPVSNSAAFSLTIPHPSNANLQIYDITGRSIDTVIDQMLDTGEYTLEWAASAFPGGLYFASLSCNEITQSVRFLCLH